MRRLILAAGLAMGLGTGAMADEDAIQDIIGLQIEAFQADDFARAFGYASPSIKRFFGGHERFGAMVQQGYPMVWRPDRVEYLGLSRIQGRLVQQVMITDVNGTLHLLAYAMIQTENGWQIDGVQVLQSPELGA